jgi:phosphocarrier protein
MSSERKNDAFMVKRRKKTEPAPVERTFVIGNKLGLHARPAAVFVQTANRFGASVEVQKEDLKIDGKSIMGIMTLAAEKGSSITVRVTGQDAEVAMEALATLIASNFGE